MSARFEVFEDEAGEFRWRLLAANGEIVATSESYTRQGDALRGISDLADNLETMIIDGEINPGTIRVLAE